MWKRDYNYDPVHDDPDYPGRTYMDELQETLDTIIDLNEPEALLRTLRDAVARKKGKRWEALAGVLGEAEIKLDAILNAKPAGPDFRPDAPSAKGNSQPQRKQELTHADATDAPDAPDAAPEASASPDAAPEARAAADEAS
jgi:hypothetical protein